MRLIDADELFKQISKNSYLVAQKNNSVEKGMTITGIKQAIDEQPTAYDVDKVVEEIQTYESSEFIRRCYDENLIYKDAAIDIVKRGGVNDNKER
jgi:hypothetical protein